MSDHKDWEPGTILVNREHRIAKLLAPTWETYAWVLLKGHKSPTTVLVSKFFPMCDSRGVIVEPINRMKKKEPSTSN